MTSRFASSFAATAVALGVAACSGQGATDGVLPAESQSELQAFPVRVVRMGGGLQSRAAARLQYFGGPVLANVKVYAVYWGPLVRFQDHVNAFYPAITNSEYLDWLSEYNTPTQLIGRGSFGGAVVDPNPPAGTRVSDAQIQSEIGKLIDGGVLPPNDGSNLYMVYFPPGVRIVGPDGAGTSCVQFCGYHGTFTKNGAYGFYGVMPDLGGACATGCGNGTPQDNLTDVSSHELIEAITDPGVGAATEAAPPLGWYDERNGEIGDICAGQADRVAGFAVQKEWSNRAGRCVARGPSSATTDGGA